MCLSDPLFLLCLILRHPLDLSLVAFPSVFFLIFLYLVLAALGLRCPAQDFSSLNERRVLSSRGMWVSRCRGFSCRRAPSLERAGFGSCGAWT